MRTSGGDTSLACQSYVAQTCLLLGSRSSWLICIEGFKGMYVD
jgi:hypothetical protein